MKDFLFQSLHQAVAPLVFYLAVRWQANFAYHVDPGADIFILAGMLTLMIALLTVAYQSIRTALADPVQALRYE